MLSNLITFTFALVAALIITHVVVKDAERANAKLRAKEQRDDLYIDLAKLQGRYEAAEARGDHEECNRLFEQKLKMLDELEALKAVC